MLFKSVLTDLSFACRLPVTPMTLGKPFGLEATGCWLRSRTRLELMSLILEAHPVSGLN